MEKVINTTSNERELMDLANTMDVIVKDKEGLERYPALNQAYIDYKSIYGALIPQDLVIENEEDRAKYVALRVEINKEITQGSDILKEIKANLVKEIDNARGVFKNNIEELLEGHRQTVIKAISDFDEKEINEKTQELQDYFNELISMTTIDYISFDSLGINVTISKSIKTLKDQVKTMVDQYNANHMAISMMENKDRVMEYFKQTLDLTSSISKVQQENEIAQRLAQQQIEQERARIEQQAREEALEVARREMQEQQARMQVEDKVAPPIMPKVPTMQVEPKNENLMRVFNIQVLGNQSDLDKVMELLEQHSLSIRYVEEGDTPTIGDFQCK